jgi:hypothetical protein
VALAIAHAVAAPRGTHLSIVEVQPEAPLRDGLRGTTDTTGSTGTTGGERA